MEQGWATGHLLSGGGERELEERERGSSVSTEVRGCLFGLKKLGPQDLTL